MRTILFTKYFVRWVSLNRSSLSLWRSFCELSPKFTTPAFFVSASLYWHEYDGNSAIEMWGYFTGMKFPIYLFIRSTKVSTTATLLTYLSICIVSCTCKNCYGKLSVVHNKPSFIINTAIHMAYFRCLCSNVLHISYQMRAELDGLKPCLKSF